MTPIQQLYLGVGAKKKTYMDDVFSTYIYKGSSVSGSGSGQTITNGINLSGEGGLVWLKSRGAGDEHALSDTVNGAGKRLSSDSTGGLSTATESVSGFTSSGFSLPSGWNPMVNAGNKIYSSWSFRRAEGFFDVVTYNGDSDTLDSGESQSVAHSLGCEPGLILIKKTSGTQPWAVYHRSLGNTKSLFLQSTETPETLQRYWNNTSPTSTHFTVGSSAHVNRTGETYVAYLFAGGESTAATARSVDFDGNDTLYTGNSNDFILDGDFTIEGWINSDNWNDKRGLFAIGNYQQTSGIAVFFEGGALKIDRSNTTPFTATGATPAIGVWAHIAIARASNTITVYVNGTSVGSYADSNSWGSSTQKFFGIGARWDQGNPNKIFNGRISNVRVVKGTAVYTSSFRPPTEPLTSISGTSLLCCNNSSVTGTTTGTVSSNGDPTAVTDSPFDDPAAFTFGDSGDQNIIKCGSYTTDSNEDANVYLGWEPQWLLVKRTDSTDNWMVVDSMRGFPNAQDVEGNNTSQSIVLEPNTTDGDDNTSRLGITPTGFYADQYGANRSYVYCAIRRPDGYVGKPYGAGEGTSVFAMDTGVGSSTIPNFDSGFPVDFTLVNGPSSTGNWDAAARLISEEYLQANTTAAEVGYDKYTFDSNTGWNKDDGLSSSYQSWMWKRHAGFDVVTYKGNGTAGHQIPHSLSKTPEMIWVKRRNSSRNWGIYHKGLNGGTNPEQYALEFWEYAEYDSSQWNDTAPTTTHFSLGTSPTGNANGDTYIAMLFASVSGISAVGSYSGSDSEQTITTGFQPRFVIIRALSAQQWLMLDTTRGWASGNDSYLYLNSNAAQGTDHNFGAPTSNGFTVTGTSGNSGGSGTSFIYYAHA